MEARVRCGRQNRRDHLWCDLFCRGGDLFEVAQERDRFGVVGVKSQSTQQPKASEAEITVGMVKITAGMVKITAGMVKITAGMAKIAKSEMGFGEREGDLDIWKDRIGPLQGVDGSFGLV